MSWSWWVTDALIVAAIAVAVVVVIGTLARLAPLRAAIAELMHRREDALDLQTAITDMQDNLHHVQQRAQAAQDHLAAMNGGKLP